MQIQLSLTTAEVLLRRVGHADDNLLKLHTYADIENLPLCN